MNDHENLGETAKFNPNSQNSILVPDNIAWIETQTDVENLKNDNNINTILQLNTKNRYLPDENVGIYSDSSKKAS